MSRLRQWWKWRKRRNRMGCPGSGCPRPVVARIRAVCTAGHVVEAWYCSPHAALDMATYNVVRFKDPTIPRCARCARAVVDSAKFIEPPDSADLLQFDLRVWDS